MDRLERHVGEEVPADARAAPRAAQAGEWRGRVLVVALRALVAAGFPVAVRRWEDLAVFYGQVKLLYIGIFAFSRSRARSSRGRCDAQNHEVAAAKARGLDVIVTDHHEPDAELPACVAVINPKRHDCHYPDKHLAGVGVAFKLSSVLKLHTMLPSRLSRQ